MKAFKEYYNLIITFHRALINKDFFTLDQILTKEAIEQFNQYKSNNYLTLPLSEDIDVSDISIEGNGTVTTVTYYNKVEPAGNNLTLQINVKEVKGQLLITKPFPHSAY